MEWRDEAIVLSARPHGETSAVVTLLTEEHGRHAGLVRGGQNPKNQAIYQAGNRVRAQWRARLADHLGSFTCEPLVSHAARLFDDPRRLPSDWQREVNDADGARKARVVGDYIAGMTDRYALDEHQRLSDLYAKKE
ncbi:MAG: DNA repair protein RecO [Proteobacteria bacterium]|nr:DNA repair protein RecO [Pseudomonadota bacterium]